MADDLRRGPTRTLWVILGVIAALIVASVVLILSRGAPDRIDPATPAGVVQRYSEAFLAGDSAALQETLSEEAKARCAAAPGGYYVSPEFLDTLRIELRSTTERETTATVRVALVQTSQGGPFGPSDYTQLGDFQLVKPEGQWLVDTAPQMIQSCTGFGPVFKG